MKRVYNIIFIITLMLTLGLITNVNASASLTPQTGGQITITRNVGNALNPVSNTFTYTITADSNNPAAVTGLPSTMNIVFNRVVPTNLNGEGIRTATQTGTLDLTGVIFPKVGDYLFTLRETSSTNGLSYPIDVNYYTIKISVRYEVDSNNVPTSTMTATVANIKNSSNTKVNEILFTKDFVVSDISITKQIRGNMADKDEYFKIKVNIDCLAGDKYFIVYMYQDEIITNSTITYNGSTINRTPEGNGQGYTCGVDNYVYLKHGEGAEIIGLIEGQEYSFVEQGALLYNTYINGSETNSKSSGNLTVGNGVCFDNSGGSGESGGSGGDEPGQKSHKASDIVEPSFLGEQTSKGTTKNLVKTTATACNQSLIINEYDSIIDTGLVLKFLPYILILLTGIVGLTLFIVFKKKHKNDEEVEE